MSQPDHVIVGLFGGTSAALVDGMTAPYIGIARAVGPFERQDTYRAVVLIHHDGYEQRLTQPRHEHLPDEDLLAKGREEYEINFCADADSDGVVVIKDMPMPRTIPPRGRYERRQHATLSP